MATSSDWGQSAMSRVAKVANMKKFIICNASKVQQKTLKYYDLSHFRASLYFTSRSSVGLAHILDNSSSSL